MLDVMLAVRVLPAEDDDEQELAAVTRVLLAKLRETDAKSIELPSGDDTVDGAKGAAALFGRLIAHVQGAKVLKTVVEAIGNWAQHSKRTVHITLGGDTLELSAATAEQQSAIIEAWLRSHGSGE